MLEEDTGVESRYRGVCPDPSPMPRTLWNLDLRVDIRSANRHQAVNLSQGFPDFDGPEFVKHAAAAAIAEGKNQYARPYGSLELVRAIARDFSRSGIGIDPGAEVTVTRGAPRRFPRRSGL